MDTLSHIPPIDEKRIAVQVKPAAEKALRRGHPWLFEGSIRRQSHEGRPGDLAVIFDARDRFLAIGLYDPGSPIRIRVLHHGRPLKIDDDWFRARLVAAFELRSSLPDTATTGYRLLNGENDGLPGLVIDRYADTLVVRLDTAAWLPHLAQLLSLVLGLLPAQRLVLRLSRRLQSFPATLHGLSDGQLLHGIPIEGPEIFLENGLRFEVDLLHGQKTGFFLDQRDNRSRLETLVSQNGDLRWILNTFAYTGAFAVYAARGGAEQLTNVDTSRAALAAAGRNLRLNDDQWTAESRNHETITGDAFAVLGALHNDKRQFDVVIIDPPSFAKNLGEVGRAKGAYRRLTHLGLALLRPQGLLVTSSCSSRISAESFFELVDQSAKEAGRPLQEVVRTGHPLDHPISFPEGAYLKCLFARAP